MSYWRREQNCFISVENRDYSRCVLNLLNLLVGVIFNPTLINPLRKAFGRESEEKNKSYH